MCSVYLINFLSLFTGSLLTLCIDLCTELVPATSLAYEDPESLIMQVTVHPWIHLLYCVDNIYLTTGSSSKCEN